MSFLKTLLVLNVLILYIGLNNSIAQDTTKPYWYTYMADYEGKPGSTVVDMFWYKKAPFKGYDYAFKIMIDSKRELIDGLPDTAELTRMDNILSDIYNTIAKKTAIINVGSFAVNSQRCHYNYVKDTTAAVDVARDYISKHYPNEIIEVKARIDSDWVIFFDFLYPNEETIKYVEEHMSIKPLYHH